MKSVINLGFGPSAELRKLLKRQEELLKEISAPSAALAEALAFRNRIGDLAEPARRIAQALEFADFRPFELSGLDQLRKIGDTLKGVAASLKVDDIAVPTTGLLGLPVDFDLLAENERLSRLFADAGYQALFADITHRLQERSEDQVGQALPLSEVLEATADELTYLPEADARRFDPITLLSLILTIMFGLYAAQMARGTDSEIRALRRESAEATARHEAQIDSLTALVEDLVSRSLDASNIRASIAPTHVTTRRLHLRSRPSAKSLSLGVSPAGTSIQVISEVEGWARVAVGRSDDDSIGIGWMYARYLAAQR